MSSYLLRLPPKLKDAGMAWSKARGISFRRFVEWAIVDKLYELEWNEFCRDPRNQAFLEEADRLWQEAMTDFPGPDDRMH
ncbi:MAG: hypothetical protein AAFY56_18585 [Pseudomonadota bacterium]